MTKYVTWYVKSRKKLDVFIGVDEHEDFKSRKWTDKKGNSGVITFGILMQITREQQSTIL